MEAFVVFGAVWLAMGIAFAIVIYGPANVRVKRQVWRYGVVVAGVLFAAFVWWQSRAVGPPWFFFLAIAGITWMNLKMGRFCDACGAFQQRMFRAPWDSIRPQPYCSRCGEKIPDARSTDA